MIQSNGAGSIDENVRKDLTLIIPGLDITNPDTKFCMYREYKPMKETIEYTVFYTEPGQEKQRIDFSVPLETAVAKINDGIKPPFATEDITITYHGDARTAIQ